MRGQVKQSSSNDILYGRTKPRNNQSIDYYAQTLNKKTENELNDIIIDINRGRLQPGLNLLRKVYKNNKSSAVIEPLSQALVIATLDHRYAADAKEAGSLSREWDRLIEDGRSALLKAIENNGIDYKKLHDLFFEQSLIGNNALSQRLNFYQHFSLRVKKAFQLEESSHWLDQGMLPLLSSHQEKLGQSSPAMTFYIASLAEYLTQDNKYLARWSQQNQVVDADKYRELFFATLNLQVRPSTWKWLLSRKIKTRLEKRIADNSQALMCLAQEEMTDVLLIEADNAIEQNATFSVYDLFAVEGLANGERKKLDHWSQNKDNYPGRALWVGLQAYHDPAALDKEKDPLLRMSKAFIKEL